MNIKAYLFLILVIFTAPLFAHDKLLVHTVDTSQYVRAHKDAIPLRADTNVYTVPSDKNFVLTDIVARSAEDAVAEVQLRDSSNPKFVINVPYAELNILSPE